MMHKRTLHSLLIVSFIVVFAASFSFAANNVNIQSKAGLPRCVDQAVNVTADLDIDVSAVEGVFVITSTSGGGFITNLAITWNLPAGVLSDRVIDLSKANGVAPDTIRFAAMRTGETDGVLAAGTGLAVATIGFHTADVCTGVATIAGIEEPGFSFPHPTGPIVTQFVDAATDMIVYPDAVNAGTVAIANQVPTLAAIADQTVVWGHPLTVPLVGADADLANGCETVTYSFVGTPPAGMAITGTNVTWTPTGDQVCTHAVTVKIADECGGEATQAFNVCVSNQPPVFTDCPTEVIEIAYGETLDLTLHATDPDGGPYKLYNITSFDGPNTPTVTKVAGNAHIVWDSETSSEYGGTFTMCVEVTDNAAICDPCAPVNSDECCFQVKVVPYKIAIEKLEDAYLGQVHTLDVFSLLDAEIAGFDLLIQYDPSAMSFISAEAGEFIVDCEWEYFTYRFGPNGNCGPSACPTGVLRVTAMAETTGGNIAHHPVCYVPGDRVLFSLDFLLSSNANLECQFAPVRFVWYDCSDNGVSSKFGDYLYISQLVYDFAGFDGDDPIYTNVTNMDNTFPTVTGAPDIAECNVSTEKGAPVRTIHFYGGGFDIPCAVDIDAVGDINLNNVAYEIADAVMFTQYFIQGEGVFEPHVVGSIAASDCNKDGLTLTVADLVYLIRVVVGDAQPYPKTTPVAARFTVTNNEYGIDIDAGAAYLVFAGDVTPTLLAPGVNMYYGMRDGNTHVVVVDEAHGNSFTGAFLRAEGRLISSEIATRDGLAVVAKLVPTEFAVSQNYPNPFNPVTKISFQMPQAGAWAVDIYNINGQRVQSLNGNHDAGYVDVEWDASNLASGVYFYKVSAGDNSRTMKAILLK